MADKIDTPETGNTNIWATIGKLAVIVGIIVGLTQAYSFFFPAKPKIQSSGEEITTILPNTIHEKVETELNKDIFTDYLVTTKESERFINKDFKDLLDSFKSYSDRKKRENLNLISELKQLNQRIRIVVSNRGSEEAKSVNIDFLPKTSGYYSIDFSNEGAKQFEKSIAIGNIRPDTIVFVDIWIKYSSANKDEIKITYPEGSVPVQFYPDTSFTKLAWELTLPAIVLIELILIFILLGKVLNKSKQIPLTTLEETTNEDKADKNSP